ncbi:MAG: 2-oxo acid dehydrogenase subunit E2, partial [Actinobacteria bacterium]|nr:2-oxo acid dehydrogenase subunit E2 [Actinomycetota bacterium]
MPETATVQISMPEMGESVTEGIVLEWHVAEGDAVSEGDTVVEVSTDKVDAEVPAPADGVITKLIAQVDDEVPVGAALAEMEVGDGAGSGEPRPAGPAAEEGSSPSQASGDDPSSTSPAGGAGTAGAATVSGNGADVRATPIARRVADATGVDLGAVQGSGPGQKVLKEDVLAAGNGAGAAVVPAAAGEEKQLRGPAAMLAKAMDESRAVPTATSFRTIAVDTLDAKRKAVNGLLKERGLKTSFTHYVAWAIVAAAKDFPVMVRIYEERDGKSFALENGPINLGIAVDVERKDGSHSLMVPAIKGAQELDFAGFHSYYEELIAKTRENKLTADDFQGTNISLTNPGGIGTVASVPRLLAGQSAIIATGSIAYPPEWSHASPDRLRQLGVSKVMTLTSTYDHRVIQGAESGAFLRRVEQLLQGEDQFYERVAADLGIEAAPITAAHAAAASAPPLSAAAPSAEPTTVPGGVDEELLQAVQAATAVLKAFRTHGHLAAQLDPLGSEPKGDPGLEPANFNLTPELMSRIPASILRIGVPGETLLEALPRLREAYCGTIGYQFEHLSSHSQRVWMREMIETGAHRQPLTDPEKKRLLGRLIDVFQFERFLEKTYLGQKMFSIEGLDVVVPMLDEVVTISGRGGAEE